MKTVVICLIIILCHDMCGQNDQWTWVHGSSTTVNILPTITTKGVASVTNTPGSRQGACNMTDNNGNLWIFGGLTGTGTPMGDLWKYDVINGTWTWVSGPATPSNTGIYGTKGVGSTTNNPGARYLASSWGDYSGNLWVFGGYGYSNTTGFAILNDLWKFNIQTAQWTWISGTSTGPAYGIYGTMGTGSQLNSPGSRYVSVHSIDSLGNLWLFGGFGYGQSTTGPLSDLWKFTPSTNQWTWIKGSAVSNQFSSYGTLGVSSPTCYPGARYGGTASADASGNIWMFGGYGLINNNTGYTNELWKFDVNTGNWQWLSGSIFADQSGTYGTKGTPSTNNTPGSRIFYGNGAMVDKTGNFWMHGGYGYSSGGAGYLSDLWRYNVASSQWVWKQGSNSVNQYGQYGSIGTASALNDPGSRYSHHLFKGGNGNLWLYGGYGVSSTTLGLLADLWSFDLCAIPPVPANTTPTINLEKCSGSTTTLTATNGSLTVYWFTSLTSTNAVASGTSYILPTLVASTTPSVYNYYAESKTCGSSAARIVLQVTVNPRPVISVNSGSICSGSNFVLLPSGAITYTVSGGSQVVSPSVTTSYSVSGSNIFGCVSSLNAVATVSVLTTPPISVNSGTLCSGKTFTISPSGALTYTVSGGNFVVSPLTSTLYMVTGTASNGCVSSSPAIAMLTVFSTPIITVNSGTICSGNNYIISPSGANNYVIQGGYAVVSPSVTSTYTVSGYGPGGCMALTPVTASVVVNPTPTLSVSSGTSQLCAGKSTTLYATGASSYTWIGISLLSSSGETVTALPPVTTVYTVTGKNEYGCSDIRTLTQVVNLCTGINEIKNGFRANLYPNPASGIFYCEVQQNTKLTLFNNLGQLVLTINLEKGVNELDLSDLPNSIYHAALLQNGAFRTYKVVKQ